MARRKQASKLGMCRDRCTQAQDRRAHFSRALVAARLFAQSESGARDHEANQHEACDIEAPCCADL